MFKIYHSFGKTYIHGDDFLRLRNSKGIIFIAAIPYDFASGAYEFFNYDIGQVGNDGFFLNQGLGWADSPLILRAFQGFVGEDDFENYTLGLGDFFASGQNWADTGVIHSSYSFGINEKFEDYPVGAKDFFELGQNWSGVGVTHSSYSVEASETFENYGIGGIISGGGLNSGINWIGGAIIKASGEA